MNLFLFSNFVSFPKFKFRVDFLFYFFISWFNCTLICRKFEGMYIFWCIISNPMLLLSVNDPGIYFHLCLCFYFVVQGVSILCTTSLVDSFLQVTEIYNFTQDDLMTEDIFILDSHSDIFVWVGQQVDTKNRAQALTIGEVRLIWISWKQYLYSSHYLKCSCIYIFGLIWNLWYWYKVLFSFFVPLEAHCVYRDTGFCCQFIVW